ncbi:MAG: ubiquinone/menaquinone biosynthesis methyltransferase [Pseudomonadota bacterium]
MVSARNDYVEAQRGASPKKGTDPFLIPMQNHEDKRYPSVTGMSQEQHAGVVREIFETISDRYDFFNRLFSLRRDVAWRRAAVSSMKFFKTRRFLDVATGTADLAVEASVRHHGISTVGLDFSGAMMGAGNRKIAAHGLERRIRLIRADALKIPFGDSTFDVAAMAFGIRNVTDRLSALREMKRVIAPGGRVMVLEMNLPRGSMIVGGFRHYLDRFMPLVARGFSKNPAAYAYLADSITHFPSPNVFAGMMRKAGLTGIEINPLTFGICHLFIGTKPQ